MSFFVFTHRNKICRKLICLLVVISFAVGLVVPPSVAQILPVLAVPGQALGLTPGFQPPILRGMTIRPENPLLFDFLVDRGEAKVGDEQLKIESEKLIKYFLASMTIPVKDAWVNLSPTEADRIIPDVLGQTEMGRVMLEQDYLLKQMAASLTDPDTELGRQYWHEVNKRTQGGLTPGSLSHSVTKVWIIPESATVVEKDGFAYISKSKLKVMMEEDYVGLSSPQSFSGDPQSLGSRFRGNDKEGGNDKGDGPLGVSPHSARSGSTPNHEVFRELILPKLIEEVNTGKTFAPTRQVYQSVILASWYKRALKDSLLGKIYADKSKVAGIETDVKDIKQKVYEQYLETFKKGVYNVIKEEETPDGDVIPRKYFSGGQVMNFASTPLTVLTDNPVALNRAASAITAAGERIVLVAASAAETREEVAAQAEKNSVSSSPARGRGADSRNLDPDITQLADELLTYSHLYSQSIRLLKEYVPDDYARYQRTMVAVLNLVVQRVKTGETVQEAIEQGLILDWRRNFERIWGFEQERDLLNQTLENIGFLVPADPLSSVGFPTRPDFRKAFEVAIDRLVAASAVTLQSFQRGVGLYKNQRIKDFHRALVADGSHIRYLLPEELSDNISQVLLENDSRVEKFIALVTQVRSLHRSGYSAGINELLINETYAEFSDLYDYVIHMARTASNNHYRLRSRLITQALSVISAKDKHEFLRASRSQYQIDNEFQLGKLAGEPDGFLYGKLWNDLLALAERSLKNKPVRAIGPDPQAAALAQEYAREQFVYIHADQLYSRLGFLESPALRSLFRAIIWEMYLQAFFNEQPVDAVVQSTLDPETIAALASYPELKGLDMQDALKSLGFVYQNRVAVPDPNGPLSAPLQRLLANFQNGTATLSTGGASGSSAVTSPELIRNYLLLGLTAVQKQDFQNAHISASVLLDSIKKFIGIEIEVEDADNILKEIGGVVSAIGVDDHALYWFFRPEFWEQFDKNRALSAIKSTLRLEGQDSLISLSSFLNMNAVSSGEKSGIEAQWQDLLALRQSGRVLTDEDILTRADRVVTFFQNPRHQDNLNSFLFVVTRDLREIADNAVRVIKPVESGKTVVDEALGNLYITEGRSTVMVVVFPDTNRVGVVNGALGLKDNGHPYSFTTQGHLRQFKLGQQIATAHGWISVSPQIGEYGGYVFTFKADQDKDGAQLRYIDAALASSDPLRGSSAVKWDNGKPISNHVFSHPLLGEWTVQYGLVNSRPVTVFELEGQQPYILDGDQRHPDKIKEPGEVMQVVRRMFMLQRKNMPNGDVLESAYRGFEPKTGKHLTEHRYLKAKGSWLSVDWKWAERADHNTAFDQAENILKRRQEQAPASKSSSSVWQPAVGTNGLASSPASQTYGGIDFDPSKLNLQIKRDGRGVPLPLPLQDLENIDIKGLYPVIINILPINIQTLPILSAIEPSSRPSDAGFLALQD